MPRARTVLAFAALAALTAPSGGCGARDEAADAQGKPAPAPRRDGRIRLEDQFKDVGPLVIHEARMDLYVGCRHVQDSAKAAGQEVPLCYEPAKRARSAVKVIRLEHHAGATVDAMRELSMVNEGAHFLVEKSGSIFQLMDLAFAVRRDGSNRGDEIRILAMGGKDKRGAAAEAAPLMTELRALYPLARVEELDVGGPP